MVSFRRIVLAMSILALFVGLAGAQVGTGGTSTGGPLACTALATATPALRSEGITELIGDIVIQCTGGTVAPGAVQGPVPTGNITLSLQTQVTSKLLSGGGSEALLFIDEPGTGQPGPGPAITANPCSSAQIGAGVGGCASVIGYFTPPGNAQTIVACPATGANGVCTSAPINVFQGVVSGNQVIFNGVPIIAPVTSGFTRTFRITNVRANVAQFGGQGPFGGTIPLNVSVSISGSAALPVSNPLQTAGFIQQGLSTTVRNSANSSSNTKTFLQCQTSGTTGSAGPTPAALLEFKENFATAFKTRIAANATANGAGLQTTFNQSTPGVNYNSESGLIMNINGGTAGLADFGTRLKAVFSNIPTGVRVFVSTTNLTTNNSNANGPTTPPTVIGNGLVTPPLAIMVPSEAGINFPGLNPPGTSFFSGATLLSEVVIDPNTHSGVAVWEVVQANFSALETFQFGVNYIVTGNQNAGTPAQGNSQVNLSYAPVSATTTASSSAPIPRFVDTSTASTVLTINLCQTDLLFPFVTNINGFDTGLAIANTTTDGPLGTAAQNGTCALNFFGSGAPSVFTTPNVATGTVYANTASTIAPGFQGYMIAICNFQYAHGFAFVSDVGARNLAMGYLALVIQNGGIALRGTAAESLSH
jgi:hypothetical protein